MARSKRQLENQMRVVVVAAVAREFRRAAIIEKIVSIAKSKGMVASGALTNPSKSGALMPTADDRWLVKKDSVRVVIGSYENNVPDGIKIFTNIEYGLGRNHQYYSVLWEKTPKKAWKPNIGRLARWVKLKMAQGETFWVGKEKRNAEEKDALRIAMAISRSHQRRGIKKRNNFLSPFTYKNRGVDATLRRGIIKASDRIVELYGETVIEQVDRTLLNIFQ
jgi:hypothetical protein